MEQQLLQILDNENSRKQYRYLLIDALTTVSEMDFIALNNIKELLGENTITTVIRPDLSHDLASCPKLITIGKPNQELEKRLLHFSIVEATDEILQSKRYVCGWMLSEHPPEIIIEQMVNIGSFLSKYCGTGFVPFYEPFRMQLLQEGNAICPEFIANMLNCFQAYCYPTTTQTLNIVKPLENRQENISMFFSEDAKFYQQQIKMIFQLYLSESKIYGETGKDINKISLINIAKVYQKAFFCGLTQISDQLVFALMTLRYGDLLSNPQLKRAIDDAKFDEGSLLERFQSIDREQFISIKNRTIV